MMVNIKELVKIDIKKIRKETIIISKEAHKWCQRAYEDHPNGCPNFGKALNCPPHKLSFDIYSNMFNHFYLVHAKFKFKKYKEEKAKEWDKQDKKYTEKQLGNRRHWQGSIKKLLRKDILKILKLNPSGVYISSCGSGFDTKDMKKYQNGIFSMESLKINVISTLKLNKISIKRNPIDFMRFACLLCSKKPLILPKEDNSIAMKFINSFKDEIKEYNEIEITNSKVNNKARIAAYIVLKYNDILQKNESYLDHEYRLEIIEESFIKTLSINYDFQFSKFKIFNRNKGNELNFTYQYYFKNIRDLNQKEEKPNGKENHPIPKYKTIERFL